MSAFVRVARPTFEYLRFASSESGKDRDLNTAPLVINEFGTVSERRVDLEDDCARQRSCRSTVLPRVQLA